MGLKTTITRSFGKVTLAAREHSPELLMIGGAIGVVVTVISACKATLKFQEVLEDHNTKLEKIKELQDKINSGEISEERYTLQDAKDDRRDIYVHTAFEAVKIYGPVVLIGVASIGSMGAATGIMKKRYISMASAYVALRRENEHLESEVIKEYGVEALERLKSGSEGGEVVINEDGETEKVISGEPYSSYSKFFDASNVHFEKDPESNRLFLQCKQNWMNNLLSSRGYVFLNEVYRELGIKETRAGQLFGWKFYKDPAEAAKHGAANFISFGIFDSNSNATRRFVNGCEDCILLDFNVDPEPIIGNVGFAEV